MSENNSIDEQQANFEKFAKLPLMVGLVIALAGVIGGIVTAIVSSSVGVFFIYAVPSIVVGAIAFALLRIYLSAHALTVMYLEKLCALNCKSLLQLDKISKSIAANGESQNEPVSELVEEVKSLQRETVDASKNGLRSGGVKTVAKHDEKPVDADLVDVKPIKLKITMPPSEKDVCMQALSELVAKIDSYSDEQFYEKLSAWNEKYYTKVLTWSKEVYTEINSFLNGTRYTVSYDKDGKEKRIYEIDRASCAYIKRVLVKFFDLL